MRKGKSVTYPAMGLGPLLSLTELKYSVQIAKKTLRIKQLFLPFLCKRSARQTSNTAYDVVTERPVQTVHCSEALERHSVNEIRCSLQPYCQSAFARLPQQ